MTVPPTPEELLAAFHTQIRLTQLDAAPGTVVERDGPVYRSYPEDPTMRGAMIECPEGLGDDPDHWVARQVEFFRGRGQRVEWKTYSTDVPADLPRRLSAAGFVSEALEALVLGSCADLVHDAPLPNGVRIREIGCDDDDAWGRVAALMDRVWGEESGWVNDHLRVEQRARPDLLRAFVIEQGDPTDLRSAPTGGVLSYNLLRLTQGSQFCGFWGGTTDADWRGRGLYRAGVVHRARLALAAGYPWVRVDCSPDSRPILVRLGLHAVATTTPHILEP